MPSDTASGTGTLPHGAIAGGRQAAAVDKHPAKLDADAARSGLFENWDYLGRVARRRFAWDENLADAALEFAVGEMARDDWRRVRRWTGAGSLRGFLTTMLLRLMTDFDRHRLGYHRPPSWVNAKADPVWIEAYRLLLVKRMRKREVVEALAMIPPPRERTFLQEVVTAVNARCKRKLAVNEHTMPLEAIAEPRSSAADPQAALNGSRKELLEAVQGLLDSGTSPALAGNERVMQMLSNLRSRITLSGEERLILRLRFQDGLPVGEIAKLIGFKGDLYKRLNKIVGMLRTAVLELDIES